ncbi:alkaline phosphatase [Paenibacillus macquariensis]|uniref:Alkaline phosphatase n=1 Tax=Paenibacillus macquariensis TaxID=948756 RepID=A0ABY1KEY1_9BACL|nr:alkaline phosphatase [Paenibacillus macquariensis]MEC0093478.1 alkaline phosphatase [Paenibacillus macquariensis]OAB27834.1 alkaline phosphatase [Paenibacillus macquariensis subsp. macquariensis]SIR73287.1 alkaline phosphatase [Paenibacillus macquariensis]
MKKYSKKLVAFAVVSTLTVTATVSGFLVDPAIAGQNKEKGKIKNVIFLIGDGMGVPYTTAYRYIKDDPSTPVMEKTEFDKYLVGNQMTYPEDEHENITDSASAATAMSAGIKTYNAAIAVDNDHTEVKTVLEQAKEQGKATGLVATSEITHATPAAFGAHDINRKNMDAIADDYYDQMINGKHKVDVLLGGGLSNFVRKDRNLPELFKKDGYSYVTDRESLLKDTNNQVLGLFAAGGLDKAIDRDQNTPSLEDMTNAAINRLNKDKDGFFLMIEGSQIDWAGHDNDVVAAMSEMQDFEKAFKAAIDFAKKDENTLVVATADHSTGGMSVAANGKYNFDPDAIKAAKRTPDFIAKEIAAGANVEDTLKKYIALELSAAEIKSVQDASVSKDQSKIDTAIEAIFNERSNTGWTTGGHTGEDVPVYAFGPQKEKFSGLIDNTDNAKIIFDLFGKKKNEK